VRLTWSSKNLAASMMDVMRRRWMLRELTTNVGLDWMMRSMYTSASTKHSPEHAAYLATRCR
jgi:hypothetical protein